MLTPFGDRPTVIYPLRGGEAINFEDLGVPSWACIIEEIGINQDEAGLVFGDQLTATMGVYADDFDFEQLGIWGEEHASPTP